MNFQSGGDCPLNRINEICRVKGTIASKIFSKKKSTDRLISRRENSLQSDNEIYTQIRLNIGMRLTAAGQSD